MGDEMCVILSGDFFSHDSADLIWEKSLLFRRVPRLCVRLMLRLPSASPSTSKHFPIPASFWRILHRV